MCFHIDFVTLFAVIVLYYLVDVHSARFEKDSVHVAVIFVELAVKQMRHVTNLNDFDMIWNIPRHLKFIVCGF